MKTGLLAACLAMCLPGVVSAAEVEHVVLISVDGLAASYLSDPRAELPMIRKLAKEGAVAEGMITSFPSVTWPAHVSLVTGVPVGKHGVIGNSVWDRKLGRGLTYIGDPELTKDEAIRVPTIYDALHAAGRKCGSVIWPCCNGAKSLSWTIPDTNKPEQFDKFTTPGLIEELAEIGVDIKPLREWGWSKEHSLERDELYTAVACHLLTKHQPALVLLHLITVDGYEHAYGPHTPKAYEAIAHSDKMVRRVWETLQSPPFAGQSALFVVSDHGFAPVEKLIQPNVVFRRLGWVQVDDKEKPTDRRVWCVATGGSAFIYILEDAHRRELTEQATAELKKLDGVTEIIGPDRFADLGLPLPKDNPQAPDFVVATGPGYSFSEAVTGEAVIESTNLKGAHGHLTQPDYMHATFVAAGTGIKPGVKLKTISNTAVAPTLARLLGVKLPMAEGRVMTEVLEK